MVVMFVYFLTMALKICSFSNAEMKWVTYNHSLSESCSAQIDTAKVSESEFKAIADLRGMANIPPSSSALLPDNDGSELNVVHAKKQREKDFLNFYKSIKLRFAHYDKH